MEGGQQENSLSERTRALPKRRAMKTKSGESVLLGRWEIRHPAIWHQRLPAATVRINFSGPLAGKKMPSSHHPPVTPTSLWQRDRSHPVHRLLGTVFVFCAFKKFFFCQAWWHARVMPALVRLKQECHSKLEASLATW